MASLKIYTGNRFNGGFTLIEILVVIGMLSIVGGLSLVMTLDTYRAYFFKNDRDILVSALHKARSQSINNMCLGACTGGKPHGVHIESGNYTIFQGITYSASDPINEKLGGGNAATTVSGLTDVVFTPLTGAVATPGSMVVTDTSGRTTTITVNVEGRIDWSH